MCAVAGIVNGTNQLVEKMLDIQRHRGPDDSNTYEHQNVQLGMARLKIIDLVSDGLCLFKEGEYILTYNGEIYNYLEIRAELEALGINFKTTSDTEVVLKAYIQWGCECFARFNGMFAIGIYNEVNRTIILARDIAGEKPLYYYSKGKQFAFASEAKAFNENFDLTKREDRSFFNAFEHCNNETLYSEVLALPPASFMIYDANKNSFTIEKYWKFEQVDINIATADEELEELLDSAVNLRTRSDVPYGLYFSGGLDSSLISTFHEFEHQYYFDNSLDWEQDFRANIDKVVWHLDFPVGSLSSYPLWKLAEMASKDVKVVLSGEGADELFGGYVRYLPIANEYNLKKNFPSYTSYLFKKYFRFNSYSSAFASLTARNDDLVAVVDEHLKPYFEMFEDPVNAMGYADFELVMPSLLQMGDRMSSAFSLENRCPFLDKRIIQFGFSLPSSLKINVLEQKYMLRKLAKKKGLQDALNMEKKGLSILYNKWNGGNAWDRGNYFEQLKNISLSV